jgi:hypothetical protein
MDGDLGPSDVPLLLLPIRLETAFDTQPDGSALLRIRVYPDAASIDSHERDLTPGEAQWGAHYWAQAGAAGSGAGSNEARLAAWHQLADRFGVPRAAWIVRAGDPAGAGTPPPGSSSGAPDDEATWRHPALVKLLPQRWTAVVYSGGAPVAVATGRDITVPLQVGPDPTLPEPTEPSEALAIDPATAWMVDYRSALAAGLALEVDLPAAVTAAGVDTLLVLGTDGDPSGTTGAAGLADLLDAHHYTDGLAVLPFGAASTNTPGLRSTWDAPDPGHLRSFAAEVQPDGEPAGGSNAQVLTSALGLPPAMPGTAGPGVLGRGEGSADALESVQRALNALVWEVGWGYALTDLIGLDAPVGPGVDGYDWARGHFLDCVRAGGPLPALRLGHQPYGLLPATSLDLMTGSPQAIWLRDLLVRLREQVWRPGLPDAPRVGRRANPPDPDGDLADLLGRDGVSAGFRVRSLFGRHFFEHLRAFTGEDLRHSGFVAAQDELAQDALGVLGLAGLPRVVGAVFAELSWPLTVDVVAEGDAALLAALAATDLDAALDAARAAQPASLLQLVARHALLRAVAVAAARVAALTPGAPPLAQLLQDAELVDLVEGAPVTQTWTRLLDRPVSAGGTVRQMIAQVAPLTDVRDGLAVLAALLGGGPDGEVHLATLLPAALDLAVDRLDAWVTSLATGRLREQRLGHPSGLRVGAFAWLENVRPSVVDVRELLPPPGETEPVLARADDLGFVHAPSTAHAAAAALLRNAPGPIDVTLTSRGARESARLLDGVRAGQPLSALFGYQLERALHDVHLDRYVTALRELAPMDAAGLEPDADGAQRALISPVVDALTLHEQWLADPAPLAARLAQAGASTDEQSVVTAELQRVGAAIDALADALTAETAYQAARGNLTRSGATLQAIATGHTPPPRLEIARQPRSGTAFTQRVVVLLPGGQPTGGSGGTTGWAATPRAEAEPRLERWAASLLGDPGRVRCTVELLDDTGHVTDVVRFPISELGLSALDVVHGVKAAGPGGDVDALVLLHAAGLAGRMPPDERVATDRPADLATGEITLTDLSELATSLQGLLGSARGLDGDDLAPPGRARAPGVAVQELADRVTTAAGALGQAHDTLADLLAPPGPTATPDGDAAVVAALVRLSRFGVPQAVPAPGVGGPLLLAQAAAVLAAAARRAAAARAAVDGLIAQPPTADRAGARRLADGLRAAFGPQFLAVAPFTCSGEQAAELEAALSGSTDALGGDPLAVETWQLRMARVRPPLDGLCAARWQADLLRPVGAALPVPALAQLPFEPGRRWAALPPGEPDDPPPHGCAAVVVHRLHDGPADLAGPLAGLLVDEWVEVIPAAEETTAVTFQFDPPGAQPPQAMLIAVPPVPGEDWTVGTLARVLLETLDLAKLRAVPGDTLGRLAQYLPALAFAVNVAGDVPSTDFGPITGRELN